MPVNVCGCTAAFSEEANSTYIVELSSGRNLQEMISGISSVIPNSIELYPGNDISVPSAIRGTDGDLAIHCKDLSELQCLSVCYFDSINNTWVGPKLADTVYFDTDKVWLIWAGFFDLVIPFRSRLQLTVAGHIVPEPVGGLAHIDVRQPSCDNKLGLRLKIYNDPGFTELNTEIDTTTDHPDFPVTYFSGSAFVPFPESGVDSTTAGNTTTVDLSKLEYENIVYVTVAWIDLVTETAIFFDVFTFPSASSPVDDSELKALEDRVGVVENTISGMTTDIAALETSIQGPKLLHNVDVVGGTVILEPAYNSYRIKPTDSTTISISSDLGEITGAEFYLIIDLSESVESITFPDNFSFVGGTAPTMNKTGYYTIRVIYSALGEGGCFGEYLGVTHDPVDLTKGIWYWDQNGELDTSVFEGQEYVAFGGLVGGTLLVNRGSSIGTLTINELDYPEQLEVTVNLHGTIQSINCAREYEDTTINIVNGYADIIDGVWDYYTVNITGGTVGRMGGLYIRLFDGYIGELQPFSESYGAADIYGGTLCYFVDRGSGALKVHGGLVVTADIENASSVYISGGTMFNLFRSYDADVLVAGGYVSFIGSNNSGEMNVDITGGSVAQLLETGVGGTVFVGGSASVGSVTLGDAAERFTGGCVLVVSGGVVHKVISEYTADDEDSGIKDGIKISGGTIGVTAHLKDQIDSGKVGLTITGGTVIYLDE